MAAALDGGDLTLAKARLLARAEKNREGLFAECVDGFVDLARVLGIQDFGQVIDQWIDLVDDQPPPDDTKRRWTSADTIGGSAHTDMFGSADDAALMRAAIEALDTPDPVDCPEGPRSRQQRHYDIVIDLFRRALADQLGDDVASPTSADVILDATTAAELVADPDQGQINLGTPPARTSSQPFDEHTAGDRFLRRRCQRPDGTSVRRALAAATLCNGWVRRIIRDPHTGTVLDVGRAHRRFTPRQRRALTIRDGGCGFPGCDRKPKWCDAHHLQALGRRRPHRPRQRPPPVPTPPQPHPPHRLAAPTRPRHRDRHRPKSRRPRIHPKTEPNPLTTRRSRLGGPHPAPYLSG